MAEVTTLAPAKAKQRADVVKRYIARRKGTLKLLGAKSFEGVQVIDQQPRSVING